MGLCGVVCVGLATVVLQPLLPPPLDTALVPPPSPPAEDEGSGIPFFGRKLEDAGATALLPLSLVCMGAWAFFLQLGPGVAYLVAVTEVVPPRMRVLALAVGNTGRFGLELLFATLGQSLWSMGTPNTLLFLAAAAALCAALLDAALVETRSPSGTFDLSATWRAIESKSAALQGDIESAFARGMWARSIPISSGVSRSPVNASTKTYDAADIDALFSPGSAAVSASTQAEEASGAPKTYLDLASSSLGSISGRLSGRVHSLRNSVSGGLGVLTAGFAPFGGTEEEDEQEEVEEVEIGLPNTPLMVQVTAAKEVPATESLKVRVLGGGVSAEAATRLVALLAYRHTRHT